MTKEEITHITLLNIMPGILIDDSIQVLKTEFLTV